MHTEDKFSILFTVANIFPRVKRFETTLSKRCHNFLKKIFKHARIKKVKEGQDEIDI